MTTEPGPIPDELIEELTEARWTALQADRIAKWPGLPQQTWSELAEYAKNSWRRETRRVIEPMWPVIQNYAEDFARHYTNICADRVYLETRDALTSPELNSRWIGKKGTLGESVIDGKPVVWTVAAKSYSEFYGDTLYTLSAHHNHPVQVLHGAFFDYYAPAESPQTKNVPVVVHGPGNEKKQIGTADVNLQTGEVNATITDEQWRGLLADDHTHYSILSPRDRLDPLEATPVPGFSVPMPKAAQRPQERSEQSDRTET